MLKKYLVLISCLLSLSLVGCGSPIKQTSSASQEVKNDIVFEVDTSATVTSEIMSSVMDTLSARFKSLGFESITIDRVDNYQVKVQLKLSNPDIQQIAEIVGQPNKFKLVGPNNEVLLTEKDFESAIPSKDETYKTFDIQFTADAAGKLANATERLIGQRVSFYLDDKQLANLVVQQPISEGQLQVPGSSTVREAKVLAAVLNSGTTLPFALKVISIDRS